MSTTNVHGTLSTDTATGVVTFTPDAVVPPLSVTLTGPASVTVGQPASFVGTASGGTPPYVLSYDYGDGSPPDLLGTHTYAQAGTYTVTVTATDKTGATAKATVQVVVTAAAAGTQTVKDGPYAGDPTCWSNGEPGPGNPATVRNLMTISANLIPSYPLTIQGTPITTLVRLAQEPRAGATSLVLGSAPVGWTPGQKLILGDSRPYDTSPDQTETVTIAGVSGSVVTLTAPLLHDHPGGYRWSGGLAIYDGSAFVAGLTGVPVLPFVANMTKTAGITGTGFVEVLGALDLTIDNALIGVHFHVDVTTKPVIRNAAFIGDGVKKWGLHLKAAPNGCVVEDSFLYNWAGACAWIGTVSGLSLQRNFALNPIASGGNRTAGPPTRADDSVHGRGNEGVGFWLAGVPANSTLRENVACGCNAYGFVFYVSPADSAGQSIPLTIDGEVYGSNSGFAPWNVGLTTTDRSTVYMRDWNLSYYGQFPYPTRGFDWHGAGFGPGQWFYGADYVNQDCHFHNLDVEMVGGLQLSTKIIGVQTINNSWFRCPWSILMGTLWSTATSANCMPRRVELHGCTFGDQIDGHYRRDVYMDAGPVSNGQDWTKLDEIAVYSPSGNFQVYYPEQAPDLVMVQSGQGGTDVIGTPDANQTNADALAKHGVCTAGALLPADAVDRPNIFGKVKPL